MRGAPWPFDCCLGVRGNESHPSARPPRLQAAAIACPRRASRGPREVISRRHGITRRPGAITRRRREAISLPQGVTRRPRAIMRRRGEVISLPQGVTRSPRAITRRRRGVISLPPGVTRSPRGVIRRRGEVISLPQGSHRSDDSSSNRHALDHDRQGNDFSIAARKEERTSKDTVLHASDSNRSSREPEATDLD